MATLPTQEAADSSNAFSEYQDTFSTPARISTIPEASKPKEANNLKLHRHDSNHLYIKDHYDINTFKPFVKAPRASEIGNILLKQNEGGSNQ